MKFLCVPCDVQMMLKETVRDEAIGALSVIFSCSKCGTETAMLTNPGETQLVQSLGVRIGHGSEGAGDDSTGKCPFAAMMAGGEENSSASSSEMQASATGPLWTDEAESRLQQVPEFVRPMARMGIEKYAVSHGQKEITVEVLENARENFGL